MRRTFIGLARRAAARAPSTSTAIAKRQARIDPLDVLDALVEHVLGAGMTEEERRDWFREPSRYELLQQDVDGRALLAEIHAKRELLVRSAAGRKLLASVLPPYLDVEARLQAHDVAREHEQHDEQAAPEHGAADLGRLAVGGERVDQHADDRDGGGHE